MLAGPGGFRRLWQDVSAGQWISRIVVVGLLAATLYYSLQSDITYANRAPFGVDLRIPLAAAERWLDGGRPYLASAFRASGENLPYLYPPWVLPFVAPLTFLPQTPLLIAWSVATALAGLGILRLLGLGWLSAVFLLWPPFAQGIWSGNVQVAIVFLFILGSYATGVSSGVLTAVVAAIKPAQPHAWLALLGRRPRWAIIGGLAVAVVLAATIVLAHPHLYRQWIGQIGRAATARSTVGLAITRTAGPVGVTAITLISFPIAYLLGRRLQPDRLVAWLGLLLLPAQANLHTYYWLFMLPAMVRIRTEVALACALLIAVGRYEWQWASFALVALALAAAERWPWLRSSRWFAPRDHGPGSAVESNGRDATDRPRAVVGSTGA